MDISEFQRILNIGLGRAIVHLQTHDSAPYRHVILGACLHCTSYDSQIEGTRAWYMSQVIELTGDEAFYREQILKTLESSELVESLDNWQLFTFTRYFAQDGDTNARRILYAKCLEYLAIGSDYGCDEVIDLDGLQGLLFVAEEFGKRFLAGSELPDSYIISHAEDEFGKEETQAALKEAAAQNPNIEACIRAFEAHEAKRLLERKPSSERYDIDYRIIREMVLSYTRENHKPFFWTIWGKRASEEDFLQAAADFLTIWETHTAQLLAYLSIFHEREFPLAPDRLLNLAYSPDDDIADHSLVALARISHPRVRALGLELMRTAKGLRLSRAVRLLAKNYQHGDHSRFERLLSQSMNIDDYHSLQQSIREVLRENLRPEHTSILMQLYRENPCSICRYYFVEMLHELNVLVDWIREECKYDANKDIRRFVFELSDTDG